ncbi:pilus assembly protein PilP [Vibrio sp.]|uniref:pilus assembly protein PilP n=1 Tax=Vibrio sp. TaxID=678 RepID=UPI003D11B14E
MKVSLLVIALLSLVGCKANQSSLTQFVQQARQQSGQALKPLAGHQPFEAIRFQQQQRDPFVLPQLLASAQQPTQRADCWQPQLRQTSGSLTGFPLTQLRLKGVMTGAGGRRALIQLPNGQIAAAVRGVPIGNNNGRVVQIGHSHIDIEETLPDGLGCWQKRRQTIALTAN